jgi:hypothetical protein
MAAPSQRWYNFRLQVLLLQLGKQRKECMRYVGMDSTIAERQKLEQRGNMPPSLKL